MPSESRKSLRRFAISGLVALAAVLGAAVPAVSASAAVSAAGSATAATAAVAHARPQTAARSGAVSLTAFSIGSKISCGSASACLSVGAVLSTKSGATIPQAESWNGKAWKNVAVATPKGATDTALQAVSCKAATACLAVGEYTTKAGQFPYALFWNGSVLTPIATPPQPKGASLFTLSAVSCLAPKSCVVAGSSMVSGGSAFDVFADTWNGTKWTASAAATPGGYTLAGFNGLRCFSLTSCYAAGDGFTSGGDAKLLIAAWNGEAWTAQKAATPTGAQTVLFNDRSCSSPASCAAVGISTDSAGTAGFGFAEIWNGKAWTVTKWTGTKSDTEAFLLGVSCVSAASCLAVGAAGTANSGAAQSLLWNGVKWAVVKVPSAGPGKASVLEGVSCTKATHCVAAGVYGPPSSQVTTPLAGYWNGSSWKLGKA
jgi:hypothetical protein